MIMFDSLYLQVTAFIAKPPWDISLYLFIISMPVWRIVRMLYQRRRYCRCYTFYLEVLVNQTSL